MADLLMPSLGADMTEGTLLEWRVAQGDSVHRGDIVAVVDTDKSAIDVESFVDGEVESLLVQPGMTVPVGTTLAVLRSPSAPAVVGVVRDADDARSPAQRVTAELMARSAREIPHFSVESTLEVGALVAALERRNAGRPPTERVVVGAALMLAIARAATRAPDLNGWLVDEAFHPAERVDLGVAISLRGGGLVVGTVEAADTLSLDGMMTALAGVTERARQGRLRSSDLVPATLTVTSLGERGAESVRGLIHPPQVALVGLGRVVRRPWAVDGQVVARPVVTVTVAADHRVSDGRRASALVAGVEEELLAGVGAWT